MPLLNYKGNFSSNDLISHSDKKLSSFVNLKPLTKMSSPKIDIKTGIKRYLMFLKNKDKKI